MSANLDYADEYGDGTYELSPTAIPVECNFPEGSSAYENVANVRFLFQHGIVNWPNFTHCLPNCGLCTQFASDHTYLIYNLVVIGFMLPFISLCGLCGNILSAFVYSRPSLRRSYTGSIYLSALGCSDTAVIVTAMFLFFIDSIRRYSLNLNIIYGSLSPIVYPAGMIAQTCSVYFTLIAGIDCFVQVCMPTEVKQLFASRRFTKCTTSVVLIFAFLYNIPHCFESVLLDCWHQSFLSPSVEVCPAPLRFHPTYTLIYYKYMYAIFLAVGPLLVLIALNTVIIIATVICKMGNSADNLALILVVLLFILCNTIALLINIFETHLSAVMSWRINYIIDISNLLVVFNSSFNFVIYYNFSRPFRCTFCHHFGSNSSQKSPSLCSRSSVNKRRAIAGMDAGAEVANGKTAANNNKTASALNEQLLLRNGLHVNRRLSVPKSATDCNGFLPVMLDNNFHHLGMLGVQQKLEEHSKLLFADQEEAAPVWERHGEGQQQGDDRHQQQQPEQEVWQHRQRTQQRPLKPPLFETNIDGNAPNSNISSSRWPPNNEAGSAQQSRNGQAENGRHSFLAV